MNSQLTTDQNGKNTQEKINKESNKTILILVILAVVISTLIMIVPKQPKTKEEKLRELEFNVQVLGREMVQNKLKDPDSATFRNDNVVTKKGITVLCGEVNSRNGFGGMGGYQGFVSNGLPDTTILEEETSDFATIWNKLCVK